MCFSLDFVTTIACTTRVCLAPHVSGTPDIDYCPYVSDRLLCIKSGWCWGAVVVAAAVVAVEVARAQISVSS